MFFAQITCVCTGGWRQIWNLPTVQLFSGFLIRVTGKRLELGNPCPQYFPAALGEKMLNLGFNLISHWWNFSISWWKYFTQTWFRQVAPLWWNATDLIKSFLETLWKVSIIIFLCIYIAVLFRQVVIVTIAWLFDHSLHKCEERFGLRGVKNKWCTGKIV